MDVVAFLKDHPLFESASEEDLTALRQRSELRELSEGDKVIEFGQPARFVGLGHPLDSRYMSEQDPVR